MHSLVYWLNLHKGLFCGEYGGTVSSSLCFTSFTSFLFTSTTEKIIPIHYSQVTLSHISVHLKKVLLSPDKIQSRTCSVSWSYPQAEGRCASERAWFVDTSKSTSDANIPQMCEGWSLLTQPQRWMLCGWAGASLIFVLERLAHVRVTHSGQGYIKEERMLLAWLQIPLSHHPPCLLVEVRGWAGPGCKQICSQKYASPVFWSKSEKIWDETNACVSNSNQEGYSRMEVHSWQFIWTWKFISAVLALSTYW